MLRSGFPAGGRFQLFSRCCDGPTGPFHVLELVGYVDSGNAPVLERELTRLVGLGEPVVVDCARLAFMASLGLRAVVLASRLATVSFCVVGLNSSVRDVFIATGIDRIVDLRTSVHAALSQWS